MMFTNRIKNASGWALLYTSLCALAGLGLSGCLLPPEEIGWTEPPGRFGPDAGLPVATISTSMEIEAVTVGDLDGDGNDDVATLATTLGGQQQILLTYGHLSDWEDRIRPSQGRIRVEGWARPAVDLEAIGDLDGDGGEELVLVGGAPSEEGAPGDPVPAHAYVLFSSRTQAIREYPLTDLMRTEITLGEEIRLRYARRAGDLDGDGRMELLLVGDEAVAAMPLTALRADRSLGEADATAMVRNDTQPGCVTLSAESADLDADGLFDLLVACDGGWEPEQPPMALFYGGPTFTGELPMASADASIVPRVGLSGQLHSQRVSGAGRRFFLSTDEGYFSLETGSERLVGERAFEGLFELVDRPRRDYELAPESYRPVALYGPDSNADGVAEIFLSEYSPGVPPMIRMVLDDGGFFGQLGFTTQPYQAELAYGDVNGDGFDDVVVATEVEGEEEVHIYFGNPFGYWYC